MTRDELAARVGVDAVTVSEWERGVCLPSPGLVASLCAALDVDVRALETVHEDPAREYRAAVVASLPPLPDEALDAVATVIRARRRRDNERAARSAA